MQISKKQTKQPDTIRKLFEEPLIGPQDKSGPIIPSYYGKPVSPGKLKCPELSVKDHTVLDDVINVEDKSKLLIGNRKCIFWQNSINDQRENLRVYINGIEIVGLIDIDTDVSVITPESWHAN